MARNFPDWLKAYCDYASFSEAPRHMHFFAGVSAIAGALRRRVWTDMAYFRWHCNHYIILVAPPGVVSKSTTAAIALDLLRQIPDIDFGPEVVTWPALVSAFAACTKSFEFRGDYHAHSSLTLESSEFGNLVNPADRDMIDLLVTLWDSKQGAFKKLTKGSGTDIVENPFINLIACTTPAWIAGNFPEYVIGGGFTSRCLFIYADKKEKYVAYPHLEVPPNLGQIKNLLVQDLEHIASNLVGPFEITKDAIDYGSVWYQHTQEHPPENLRDDRLSTYLSRRQTHLHKLAMILSASQRDDLTITAEDLALSDSMLRTIEVDMPKVFAKIGRSEESIQAERFIQFVQRSNGAGVPYAVAYQFVHQHFPNAKDFENIVMGAMKAGLITMTMTPQGYILRGNNPNG